uniref:tRNA pseudouridine(55) synthase n=1 Tax=Timema tahoe TaxID=61484 RepID=A0A7R9IG87_9NEOP|nr:unnamed protein product [Timema tahoe]
MVKRCNHSLEYERRKVIRGLVHCESNTLDHAATEAGVCWGCKVLPKLLSGDKKYFVRGRFGTATDTYNEAGTMTKEATFDHITEEMVTATLKTFVGHLLQTPPKYSALKRDGIRLADLTRQGADIIVRPRYVDCYSISCLQFSPPDFSLEVSCGGGYYIRSLVHDLGERLGSCAHVTQLHRLQHGPFTESEMLEKEDWTAPCILDAIDRARNKHRHLFKKTQRTLNKETWVER